MTQEATQHLVLALDKCGSDREIFACRNCAFRSRAGTGLVVERVWGSIGCDLVVCNYGVVMQEIKLGQDRLGDFQDN